MRFGVSGYDLMVHGVGLRVKGVGDRGTTFTTHLMHIATRKGWHRQQRPEWCEGGEAFRAAPLGLIDYLQIDGLGPGANPLSRNRAQSRQSVEFEKTAKEERVANPTIRSYM